MAAAQDKNIEREIDALKADLSSVKNDVRSLVDALAGRAQSETEKLTAAARRNVEHGVSSVEEQIERNPFTTVLIALGAGLVLGKLFSR